jgi:hypothetical protein
MALMKYSHPAFVAPASSVTKKHYQMAMHQNLKLMYHLRKRSRQPDLLELQIVHCKFGKLLALRYGLFNVTLPSAAPLHVILGVMDLQL